MTIEESTPSHRKVIESVSTELFVAAGPGAGKTATVLARMMHLIGKGAKASAICSLTFTNAGADEITRRLGDTELGFVGTLHAFALRILKEYGGPHGYGESTAVVAEEAAAELLASKAKTMSSRASTKKLLEIRRTWKGQTARDADELVVASYLEEMRNSRIVDFDLLLRIFLELLVQPDVRMQISERFQHLFVDEAQDSAPIDWEIYEALPIKNKCWVGDQDQSIFAFRGASPEIFQARALRTELFPERPTELILLEENFRSRSEICSVANRLIECTKNRIPKKTVSVKGTGGEVIFKEPFETAAEELAWVAREIKGMGPTAEVAVISKTNAVADQFRSTLAVCGIEVATREVSYLPSDWRFARSFVDLLVNPSNDTLAFFHLSALYEKKGTSRNEALRAAHAARRAAQAAGVSLNAANIKLGRVTKPEVAVQALLSSGASRESHALAAEILHELPHGSTMIEFSAALAMLHDRVKDGVTGVKCLTAHGSKGREFDAVFLVAFEDESTPGRSLKEGEKGIESERRVAFVAATRARERLSVTCALSRQSPWGEIQKRTPSRFIAELKG